MTKKIHLPYKMLIYDIETSLLKFWGFRPGEQVVRHTQLDYFFRENNIICISAKWYGHKEIFVFQGENAIKEFDKLAREADVILGKNSDKFDAKYINTARMMQGLKPFPEWLNRSDDLEKQMRRYFAFPSQSLDYISKIFGTGGKDKMEFSDWVDIANDKQLQVIVNSIPDIREELSTFQQTAISMTLFGETPSIIFKKGETALKKMIKYNKKDVTDTEAALVKVLPHIKLRRNAATDKEGQGCITCGSNNIVPTKIITQGKTKFQEFECLDHIGYAGRATWFYKKGSHNKTFGKMG